MKFHYTFFSSEYTIFCSLYLTDWHEHSTTSSFRYNLLPFWTGSSWFVKAVWCVLRMYFQVGLLSGEIIITGLLKSSLDNLNILHIFESFFYFRYYLTILLQIRDTGMAGWLEFLYHDKNIVFDTGKKEVIFIFIYFFICCISWMLAPSQTLYICKF